MRPTPAETIAGVRRILRDVIEPELASDHARSRLREVRAVLAQIDWDDAAVQVRRSTARHRAALRELRSWATTDPDREAAFAGLEPPPAPGVDAVFADLVAEGTAVAALLVAAIARLDTWSETHPAAGAVEELRTMLLRGVTEPR